MNRKFVKENKQVIREFIGKLLVNILTKRNKKALDKVIAADPTLKNKKQITLVEFISPNVKGPLTGAYLPVKGPKIIAFSPMNRQIPMV